jgi:hypothetical protein
MRAWEVRLYLAQHHRALVLREDGKPDFELGRIAQFKRFRKRNPPLDFELTDVLVNTKVSGLSCHGIVPFPSSALSYSKSRDH